MGQTRRSEATGSASAFAGSRRSASVRVAWFYDLKWAVCSLAGIGHLRGESGPSFSSLLKPQRSKIGPWRRYEPLPKADERGRGSRRKSNFTAFGVKLAELHQNVPPYWLAFARSYLVTW